MDSGRRVIMRAACIVNDLLRVKQMVCVVQKGDICLSGIISRQNTNMSLVNWNVFTSYSVLTNDKYMTRNHCLQ